MPMYSIIPIESPVSSSHLAAYKALRLASLQMDPQAFGSNYAREVNFAEEFWREWLDAPSKRTFIAAVSLDTLECKDVNGDSSSQARETGEWIGLASIVGPSDMHPHVLAPFKEAGVGANWEMYALYGMWVHPAHRSKGVAAQLIEACLAWARTHVDIKFSGENSGNFEKVAVLIVYDNNVVARALYSRAGFTDLNGVFSREGERWMLARVGG